MADKKTTPEFKEAFLAMLTEVPNLTVVCRLLGIDPSNITRARKKDKDFDIGVRGAIEQGYDLIEEEARRRAVDGVVEPIFYQGEQVMDAYGNPSGVRKYSDRLLVELLKAYKPKKFNPGVKLNIGGDGEKVTMTFKMGGDG